MAQFRPNNDYHVLPKTRVGNTRNPIPFEAGNYNGNPFINVSEDGRSVTFTLQSGPTKNGVNGCFVENLIQFSAHLVHFRNQIKHRHEANKAVDKLTEALFWLDNRNAVDWHHRRFTNQMRFASRQVQDPFACDCIGCDPDDCLAQAERVPPVPSLHLEETSPAPVSDSG